METIFGRLFVFDEKEIQRWPEHVLKLIKKRTLST